ncbi:MAG: GIY-YIG nuclease family protein [Bacteroidota bacterium]
MKRYWVYILLCSDNSFYTGMTSDLEQRVIDHNTKRYPCSYTSSRLPVKLVFNEEFSDARLAREFERRIKKWSHEKKEALIDGNIDLLHVLAECKNTSHYRNRYLQSSFDSDFVMPSEDKA